MGQIPCGVKKIDKAARERDEFVVDGPDRLIAAPRARIERDVEVEFSSRLAEANWWGRLRIQREMRNEIDRRLAREVNKRMPSDYTLW
jgi:hypothetical protein